MATNTPRLDSLERNLIINGNMDFWQRGTSFSSVNGFTADRWNVSVTGYTVTASRSTDVPTLAQSSFQSQYSLLATNGTGAAPTAGQFWTNRYSVEGFDYQQIHGKKVRLQFWIKSSVAGTYSVALRNNAADRNYVTTFTISSASTWEKKTIDIQMDTAGTWVFDNGEGLRLFITNTVGSTFSTSTLNTWQAGNFIGATGQTQLGATTGATFQLAQVMLIPQDLSTAGATTVDLPFQRAARSIGHELQMCQRYYETSYESGTALGTATITGSIVWNPSAVAAVLYVPFKATKRTSPTMVFYSPGSGASGQIRNESNSVDVAANLNRASSGGFNGQPTQVAGTQYSQHFTADSEL
jgi:hypothetical protein